MEKKKKKIILFLGTIFILIFFLYGCTASDLIPSKSTWEYSDSDLYLKFTVDENYECQDITFRYINYNENATSEVWMCIGADGFRISELKNSDGDYYAKEGKFIGAGNCSYKTGDDYIKMSFIYRNQYGEYEDSFEFTVKRVD